MQKKSFSNRCYNCLKRMQIEPEQDIVKCPNCGQEWRVTWVTPETPHIRGKKI